jgi:putative transposon-encoded protein
MCKVKSGIILKDQVFIPDYDSHTQMLEALNIKDTQENASNIFVRVELFPMANDFFSDIDTWSFNVDQDILPDWFVKEYDEIRMRDAVKVWAKDRIFINQNNLQLSNGSFYVKNCHNVSFNNSTVESYGNSTVKSFGNSTVESYGNSTVKSYGNSTVESYGNSTVKSFGNSTVESYGNSTVKSFGNSTVESYDNSTVKSFGNSTVESYGNSTVKSYDNSTVKSFGNSTVESYDNSTVESYGNSTVESYDNSTVESFGNSTVILTQFSSNTEDNIIIAKNATFKNCKTKTLYQSGDWKFDKDVIKSEQ